MLKSILKFLILLSVVVLSSCHAAKTCPTYDHIETFF